MTCTRRRKKKMRYVSKLLLETASGLSKLLAAASSSSSSKNNKNKVPIASELAETVRDIFNRICVSKLQKHRGRIRRCVSFTERKYSSEFFASKFYKLPRTTASLRRREVRNDKALLNKEFFVVTRHGIEEEG